MSAVDDLIVAAPGDPRHVVLAEAADERMIRAARALVDQHIASPILTGTAETIHTIARDCNVSLDQINVVEPGRDPVMLERYARFCETGPRPLKFNIAQRLLTNTLMYSAMMVRCADAHAMIAGSSVTTARVIQAGLMMIGTADNIKTASSFFVMTLPDPATTQRKVLIFADCAVNVDPNPEQLADIACSTVQSAKLLLDEQPRVALLSFSSRGSAQHALVDKVQQALELAKARLPEVLIDGEFQFDAGFDMRTATLKLKQPGPVAGQANVFIFPDLNAGNIGYKIAQYLGGAQAIGPILQGFAKPISDLSRGATVDDIVSATRVLLATSYGTD